MAFDFDYLVGKVLNIDDFTAKVESFTRKNIFAPSDMIWKERLLQRYNNDHGLQFFKRQYEITSLERDYSHKHPLYLIS
jgi:hypothetical protein